jgi:type IV secretory pathway TraG/TraD family ATPase VirD4
MFALIWEFIQLRAKLDKKDRQDFSVYIDEFQNYVTETFSSVLSEARKYALSLVIAHQYLDQIKESNVLAAVLGNCGTVISLQI